MHCEERLQHRTAGANGPFRLCNFDNRMDEPEADAFECGDEAAEKDQP